MNCRSSTTHWWPLLRYKDPFGPKVVPLASGDLTSHQDPGLEPERRMEAMLAVKAAINKVSRCDVFTIDTVLRDIEGSWRRRVPPQYILDEQNQLLERMLSRGDCWALTAPLGASDGR